MKTPLKLTVDNKHIIPIFKLHDQSGLPWDMIALELKERGLVPDWLDFFTEACKAKWKRSTIDQATDEIAAVFGWSNDLAFKDRCDLCLEFAALRTGWTEDSWLAGRKTPVVLKVER
jgi:hypothetical protein